MSTTKGKIFFIVGPSGVGKGTCIQLLKKDHPEFVYPKSWATRPMRTGESQDNPYHFVSVEQFEKEIHEDGFLEWAKVHNLNYYGTPHKPIKKAVSQGKIIIKELDIQGAMQARKKFSGDALKIMFLLPPSKETLMKRITHRSDISQKELNARMESLEKEIAQADMCDIKLQLTEKDTISLQYKKFEKTILENI